MLVPTLSSSETAWYVLGQEQHRPLNTVLPLATAAYTSHSFTNKQANDQTLSLQVYEQWAVSIRNSGIPISDPFKVELLLTSDTDVAKWNSEGLPANEMSTQNGILTTMSARWPLCIDPQMQVNLSSTRFFVSKIRFCSVPLLAFVPS